MKNTAVSNWESGNNSVDIETLFLACRIFGVSLNDMYGIYSEESSRLSDSESELLRCFRSLNPAGQIAVLAAVHGVASEPIYKSDNTTSSTIGA